MADLQSAALATWLRRPVRAFVEPTGQRIVRILLAEAKRVKGRKWRVLIAQSRVQDGISDLGFSDFGFEVGRAVANPRCGEYHARPAI